MWPQVGIIAGSGLGNIADSLQQSVRIPYSDIPGFPVTSVPGHAGELVIGMQGGKVVACMKGRPHPYEGIPVSQCILPTRVMRLLGVSVLLITNACGSLNPDLNVGDIVILKDHISLTDMIGMGPLVGPNDERWGTRFPSINQLYDRDLRQLLMAAARDQKIEDHVCEGVYCHNGGPCYRTVTEIRFMRDCLKADIVGMSTAYEAIAASHCGIRVAALSLVSGKCVAEYDSQESVDHKSVIQATGQRVADIKKMIGYFVSNLQLDT